MRFKEKVKNILKIFRLIGSQFLVLLLFVSAPANCTQTQEEELKELEKFEKYNLHPLTQNEFKTSFQSLHSMSKFIINIVLKYKEELDKTDTDINKENIIRKIQLTDYIEIIQKEMNDNSKYIENQNFNFTQSYSPNTSIIKIDDLIKPLCKNVLFYQSNQNLQQSNASKKDLDERTNFDKQYRFNTATEGRTGARVDIVKDNQTEKTILAVKIFEGRDKVLEGIVELANSLVALTVNPVPHKLKMTRMFAATYHKGDHTLDPSPHIIFVMEGATGSEIYTLLKIKPEGMEEVLKASAEYLASLHFNMHYLFFEKDEILDGNSLDLNVTNEKIRKNRLRYVKFEEVFYNNHASSYSELITPDSRTYKALENVFDTISTLKLKSRLRFDDILAYLTSVYNKAIERNKGDNVKGKIRLTMTHGDMHGANLFYDPDLNDSDFTHRLTMIDFGTMINTYGALGDPAEDVGRFVGSLWSRTAHKGIDLIEQDFLTEISHLNQLFNKVSMWQKTFIEAYIKSGKLSGLSEELFRENIEFYKLRYYKVKFSNQTLPIRVKQRLLYFWLQELESISKY